MDCGVAPARRALPHQLRQPEPLVSHLHLQALPRHKVHSVFIVLKKYIGLIFNPSAVCADFCKSPSRICCFAYK